MYMDNNHCYRATAHLQCIIIIIIIIIIITYPSHPFSVPPPPHDLTYNNNHHFAKPNYITDCHPVVQNFTRIANWLSCLIICLEVPKGIPIPHAVSLSFSARPPSDSFVEINSSLLPSTSNPPSPPPDPLFFS